MTDKQNIMATPAPWDLVASGYAETTMQMLAQYAEVAVDTLALHDGSKVLDVACGSGSVSLMVAKQVESVHAIDFSVSMLDICKQKADENHIKNIQTFHGDAQKLPFENAHFDAAISMFGLMFFPDRKAGLAEMYRTLKQGGRVAISSWSPVVDSPAMNIVFGAMREMNPDIPEPQTMIDSLENPDVFQAELETAGFKDVNIKRITKHFPVESVTEFWKSMVIGHVGFTMMKHQLSEAEWLEKEKLALAYLHQYIPHTPTTLAADAWLGMGVK
ncbi:MAG: class I SAM-dependent methyltransferase [Ghiorsea sp.]|nr:class I SAM-dependent methyltransferase [Ghiorsea sp.]